MGAYVGSSVYNDSPITEQEVKDLINENGKGVFFAIHGETTFSNVLAEYNKGKVIICKYDPETPGEQTEWYFTLVRFNTETFDFVGVMKDGTIYRTGLNVNDGWENITTFIPEEIFIATYDVTSYADILDAYNSNKFILTKYDIPNTNYTIFVPLTFKGNTPFYFELIDRRVTNQKIQMSIDTSNIWDFSVSNIVTVDAALDPTSHNPVENMAIAAELTAINNKITGDLNDIFLALASKGVTVPAGAGLDDVAGLIDTVPSGGAPDIIPSGGVYTQGKALDYYGAFSGVGVYVPVTDLENSVIEISFKLKSIGNYLLTIGRKSNPNNPLFLINLGGYLYGVNAGGAYVPWGNAPGDIYLPDFIGQQIDLKLYPDGTLKWNDITSSGGGWSTPDNYISIGSIGYGSVCFSMDLYDVIVKSGTSTNGYFLPCKRTNVSPYHVGLYNVVNNVMYDASGSMDIII